MGLTERMDASEFLARLANPEKQALRKLLKKRAFSTGACVFRENDPGESLFIVESGVVVLKRWITEGDIETSLLTALSGNVFGELSFMDKGGRSATAYVEEDCVLLELSRDDFDAFCHGHAAAGMKILDSLLAIIVGRLRLLNHSYMDALQGEVQATGARQLQFQHLIASNLWVRVERTTGKTITGKIVQVQKGEEGAQIILRDTEGDLVMIPYHAVASIAFDKQPRAKIVPGF